MRGGCTSKVITTVNGVEKELTNRTEVDLACAEENQRKYHLPEIGHSQLLPEDFIQDLGHQGEGPEIHNVLNGTYVPPKYATSATKNFLNACKTQQTIIDLAAPQDVTTRYKKQKHSRTTRKEKTTTYNQSIARYKAFSQ